MTATAEETTTRQAIASLNVITATTADLQSQIKQAHWNLVGAGFQAIHEALDTHADAFRLLTDEFAERVRALGGIPAGTVRQSARASILPDLEVRELPWEEAVEELAQRYEQYSQHLQECAKRIGESDLATQDLCIEAIRAADQYAWMLRANLGPLAEGSRGRGSRRR
ncbi:MAG: DNA starvation/stationary phase protection protein [Dehalococcoidia bacterium]|nr:DNA starvation/stationary phase protection protein [Dehalococcoidia bacterium]